MTDSPEELAAVEQLLAESDALRSWLLRLDQAPVDASTAVRSRVRADYQRRLDQVTDALQQHSDLLEAKLSDDRAEHETLHAQATTSRDALAEAELRFAVGEFDEEQIAGERTRHHGDIETYDLALAAVAERITRLEQIHKMASKVDSVVDEVPPAEAVPPPPAAPVEPEPARAPEPEVAQPVAVATEVAPADIPIEGGPVEIGTLAPDADTESFLSVFADSTMSIVSDETVVKPSAGPAPEIGPLSFRPAAIDGSRPPAAPPARPRPFDGAAPLGLPSADQPPRFVRPGERMRQPAPPSSQGPGAQSGFETASMSAATSGASAFGNPPPVASDPLTPTSAEVHEAAAAVQVGRTLRCGECGAMNRPLEWYCEKCGAELTAI